MSRMFNKSDFVLDEAVDGDSGLDDYIEEPDEEEATAEDMDFINDGPVDYQDKSKERVKKRCEYASSMLLLLLFR